MRFQSRWWLFALPLLVCAQTPDTATIQGRVLDQSHAGVEGAVVTAKNSQTGLDRTTQTSPHGNFTLAGLSVAGKYEIKAAKPGFADARLAHVTLAGGTTAEISLQLDARSLQFSLKLTF